MVPYVILLFMISLFGVFYHEKVIGKKLFLTICFLLLGTMSAFRSVNVGVDTITYSNMYSSLTLHDQSRIEPLFRALCVVLNFVSSDSRILIIVTGYLISAGFCLFIYKFSRAPFFSVILFILFNHYFISMNLMRQSIALVIGLTALPLCKKNKILFALAVCVAALFHYSAIVLILYVFFYNLEDASKVTKIVVFGTILAVVTLPYILKIVFDIFPQYRTLYAGTEYLGGNMFGAVLETLRLIGILSFLKINKYDKKSTGNPFFANMILVAIAFQIMGTQINIISRMVEYFSVFEIVAIPDVFKSVKPSAQKNAEMFTLLLIAGLYFVVIAIFRPGWHGAIPYEWWGSK